MQPKVTTGETVTTARNQTAAQEYVYSFLRWRYSWRGVKPATLLDLMLRLRLRLGLHGVVLNHGGKDTILYRQLMVFPNSLLSLQNSLKQEFYMFCDFVWLYVSRTESQLQHVLTTPNNSVRVLLIRSAYRPFLLQGVQNANFALVKLQFTVFLWESTGF